MPNRKRKEESPLTRVLLSCFRREKLAGLAGGRKEPILVARAATSLSGLRDGTRRVGGEEEIRTKEREKTERDGIVFKRHSFECANRFARIYFVLFLPFVSSFCCAVTESCPTLSSSNPRTPTSCLHARRLPRCHRPHNPGIKTQSYSVLRTYFLGLELRTQSDTD
jgi:hypothetical protein